MDQWITDAAQHGSSPHAPMPDMESTNTSGIKTGLIFMHGQILHLLLINHNTLGQILHLLQGD